MSQIVGGYGVLSSQSNLVFPRCLRIAGLPTSGENVLGKDFQFVVPIIFFGRTALTSVGITETMLMHIVIGAMIKNHLVALTNFPPAIQLGSVGRWKRFELLHRRRVSMNLG